MTYAQRELARIARLEAAGLLNRIDYQCMTPCEQLAFNRGNERKSAEQLELARRKKS